MSNRTYTISRADPDSEAQFLECLDLCAKQARQGAFAPINPEKVAAHCYNVMEQGLMIVARDGQGKAIAMLPLSEEPLLYADETYLQNFGLWIEPEWRTTGVLRALLTEAKREAIERETFALITITDPDRKPKQTDSSLESQIIGYVPVGYTFKLKSKANGR